ncbi:hypothetical protein K7G98_15465 [Saccharothrix sp. MB29]|nr:hypothetical protein [Saccharothrix sp. MB29]
MRGGGENGAVRLPGAHIRGQFNCADMRVSSPSGLLLDLGRARVDGAVLVPARVVCPDADRDGECGHPGRVDLGDFAFTALRDVDWRQWLHLVAHHTTSYRPQPFQQPARGYGCGPAGNAPRCSSPSGTTCAARPPLWAPVGQGSARLWGRLAGYSYRTSRWLTSP